MLNEQLSTTRAQLVADELISYGINEINIVTQGWGEAAPLAPNDTEEGRDMNRRVEVVIRR
jgi:outer membrane protein OmpA-like peptidoglycan-associated protein